MAAWVRELDISDEFQRAKGGATSVQSLAATIAEKLAAMRPLDDVAVDEARVELAEDFSGMAGDDEAGTGEFDALMDRLYDWADTPLDDKWNGKKACWVKTF